MMGLLKLSVLVLCLQRRHLASEHFLKPSFGNELSYLALTTMPFKFLGLLNAAIGECLKKVGHSFVSVKNGQIISKDAVKVLKGGMVGSDKWNPAFV